MWRWSLGKSIGRALVEPQSLNYVLTNPLCHHFIGFSRFNSSSNHHEDNERKYEAEANVGSHSNLGVIQSNASTSWKELKKQNIKYQKVTKGDVIDLRQFLFTEYRDYLIRNDGTQVKAEQLAGKVIILYFMTLSHDLRVSLERNPYTSLLRDIYNHFSHSRRIEIVFIAFDDANGEVYRKHFEDTFSRMPWTAIPFSDVMCRRSLARNFYINNTTTLFVVDSTGTVLQRDAKSIVNDYGVLGFPFSDERIKALDAEDDAAVQQPSLMTLLGSPQRDYVITNKGEKVPIHSLEEKVIALYFYEDVCDSEEDTRNYEYDSKEDITRIYEELAKTKENFEVVLIYLTNTSVSNRYADEETFWKAFRTMPWLALPFKDPNIQKLKRLFEFLPLFDTDYCDLRPLLVIFGPHGEFIEPLGYYIMGNCPVYPFTCEKVAKFELEKVQNLKMEMLWDPNTVFIRMDGSQMRFSQLAGKRVMHIFERKFNLGNLHIFLLKLKERYLQLRGTNDEFEVIHILEEKEKCVLPMQDLPWLVSCVSKLLPGSYDFFYKSFDLDFFNSTLLAFNQNGNVVRKTMYPVLEDTDFPFYLGSMMEEALSQLIRRLRCDYWNVYPKKGRIYTLHKKFKWLSE